MIVHGRRVKNFSIKKALNAGKCSCDEEAGYIYFVYTPFRKQGQIRYKARRKFALCRECYLDWVDELHSKEG